MMKFPISRTHFSCSVYEDILSREWSHTHSSKWIFYLFSSKTFSQWINKITLRLHILQRNHSILQKLLHYGMSYANMSVLSIVDTVFRHANCTLGVTMHQHRCLPKSSPTMEPQLKDFLDNLLHDLPTLKQWIQTA